MAIEDFSAEILRLERRLEKLNGIEFVYRFDHEKVEALQIRKKIKQLKAERQERFQPRLFED